MSLCSVGPCDQNEHLFAKIHPLEPELFANSTFAVFQALTGVPADVSRYSQCESAIV